MSHLRLPLIGVTLLALAACGGADSDTSPLDESQTPTAPAPPPVATPPANAFPGVTAFLTLDLNALPNFASPAYPVHYDAAVIGRDNSGVNPVTDAGAALGSVLFHDRQLSINGRVSCASCHQQADGFTDRARFSVGFDGERRTDVHSMRLANARFQPDPGFFWDRRAATLELLSTEPIRNSIEMGFDNSVGGIDSLVRRMRTLPYYPELFRVVFGDTVITEARMQRALAQHLRSIVSTRSRWDDGYARVYSLTVPNRGLNLNVPGLSAQENRGRQLYFDPPPQGGAGCAGCHAAPTFVLAAGVRGNGLDAGEQRAFKSPSLKNVSVRGPYMHDGRFATLEAVVEHYNSGVRGGPALDPRLRGATGQPLRLNLSIEDKAALVAFLHTLTDTELLSDPKFGNPFRR
jgi:cytochrome c peroxidase